MIPSKDMLTPAAQGYQSFEPHRRRPARVRVEVTSSHLMEVLHKGNAPGVAEEVSLALQAWLEGQVNLTPAQRTDLREMVITLSLLSARLADEEEVRLIKASTPWWRLWA